MTSRLAFGSAADRDRRGGGLGLAARAALGDDPADPAVLGLAVVASEHALRIGR